MCSYVGEMVKTNFTISSCPFAACCWSSLLKIQLVFDNVQVEGFARQTTLFFWEVFDSQLARVCREMIKELRLHLPFWRR